MNLYLTEAQHGEAVQALGEGAVLTGALRWSKNEDGLIAHLEQEWRTADGRSIWLPIPLNNPYAEAAGPEYLKATREVVERS